MYFIIICNFEKLSALWLFRLSSWDDRLTTDASNAKVVRAKILSNSSGSIYERVIYLTNSQES